MLMRQVARLLPTILDNRLLLLKVESQLFT
nr:MAG TPA: hypothetical protein [Caudoviricetes sp.]